MNKREVLKKATARVLRTLVPQPSDNLQTRFPVGPDAEKRVAEARDKFNKDRKEE